MTQQAAFGSGTSGAHEGEDFVCNLCGCEIMVKHWGHPRAHTEMGVFVCHCGATMRPEHPGAIPQADTIPDEFNPNDFLSQGSGVGGPGAGDSSPADALGEGV